MTPPRIAALLAALTVAVTGCVPAPTPAAAPSGAIAPVPTAVGTLPLTPSTIADPVAAIMSQARGWAYRVRSTQCLATGSSFALVDWIVSNRHVVSGSSAVQLSTWDGADIRATVSAISAGPGPDLGLIARDTSTSSTTATLASADPTPGTPVYAVGYPLGNQLTVTPGTVIDYVDGQTLGDQGQLMEITNAILPGNSGSALVDGDGKVVGVVFATRRSNNVGLVIPVSELNAFLSAPGSDVSGACEG
jgi:S1-C subfamily serine protease